MSTPVPAFENAGQTSYELFAANGTIVHTYGCITLRLDLGLQREFSWRFVIADVTAPIIGSDFLCFYNLLVDMRNRRLIDNITKLTVNGASAGTYGGHIKVVAGNSRYHALIQEFPDIIRPAGVSRELRHSTVHHIRTTPGPPVTSRSRRLAPDRPRIAKSEFEMLRNDTARCSDSPWASPLHLVPKKEDGWRPCGDYRALNARTVPDQYTVRHIADFAHHLEGRKFFSTIDLVEACHQIPVHSDDIAKQPLSRHLGFLNFRTRHSGSETPRKHFSGSSMGYSETWTCYAYIDDVLVASTSKDEHEQHLRTLSQRFSEYGVLLNPAKCFFFGGKEVTFLGYTVSAEGTRPLEEKVAAINRFKQPALVKNLSPFLGMLNFYRRFIPQAASIQAPLHAALAGHKVKGSQPVDWTPTMVQAFEDCKASLSRATLLADPDPSATLALFTDASDTSIGAALQQRVCDA